ncbi:fructokinase [Brevibacterium sanguinis]|uniref:Fructokinase n=2 Tax=Brevibacterium TaxID=1696 RepID=A0A366IKA7_9MICO|nr:MULTISPECIES: carbohydrate kinase [Brevibacterium]RBP66216.1 fructokinase [Brevibacterium sanguinis]RBP72867.1 fructokinase [Brevibacterium celere]
MSILVIGEALIDIVAEADGTEHPTPGGAPLNIAIGLGRLGLEVALLTDLGDDEHGELLLDHLRSSHVEVHARRAGRTATARAVLSADGSADYRFDLRWDPEPEDLAERPWSGVHIGSIAAFVSPGAEVVDAVLDRIDPDTTFTSFDPNIRPSIIGAHAEALARFEELAARVDVVKLSDVDADWLYPGLDPDDQVSRVLGLGADCVAMTCGAAGSIVATAARRCRVDADRVTVRDTIGAGDAFMTSLIRDLHPRLGAIRGLEVDDLRRLGRNAARISGITVSRDGADLPWAHELEENGTLSAEPVTARQLSTWVRQRAT